VSSAQSNQYTKRHTWKWHILGFSMTVFVFKCVCFLMSSHMNAWCNIHKSFYSRVRWLMTVIPATWEAIGRIMIWGQLGKNVSKTSSQLKHWASWHLQIIPCRPYVGGCGSDWPRQKMWDWKINKAKRECGLSDRLPAYLILKPSLKARI
jgi:hypothetical protein